MCGGGVVELGLVAGLVLGASCVLGSGGLCFTEGGGLKAVRALRRRNKLKDGAAEKAQAVKDKAEKAKANAPASEEKNKENAAPVVEDALTVVPLAAVRQEVPAGAEIQTEASVVSTPIAIA